MSIALLDCGSQYLKLIDKKIRSLNCSTTLFPIDTPVSELLSYDGVIISGGPDSVYAEGSLKCDPLLFLGDHDLPVLGICYGMQLMNFYYGGVVQKLSVREDGQTDISVDNSVALFEGLSTIERVLLTHGDSIVDVPEEIQSIASSRHAISGIKHVRKKQYGIQFHPEVDLSVNGIEMFKNFLFTICGCKASFTLENRLEEEIKELRETVGDKDVVVLVSGGVDSTVCAKLLFSALNKDNVYAIHVDTGFMRDSESDMVKLSLEDSFEGHNIKVLNCTDEFLNGKTMINGQETAKLCETTNPEEKRKIIGDTFIKIITEQIEQLGLTNFYLAQGTLRPDLIESASKLASGKADTIKTHHNDTELVRQKRDEGLILEPLKDYHKDEVREIGELLGLPHEMVWRQPFPGPGLAVRILCQDESYSDPELDQIAKDLKGFNTDYFSVHLLPIKSVGVQGDGRTYKYVAGITTNKTEINWDELFDIAKEIPQSTHAINRVVFIFGDHITQIDQSITPTRLTPDATAQLRQADKIFNADMIEHQADIAQAPVILTPLNFGIQGNRSIVLRPFITRDFMTGTPGRPNIHFPEQTLLETVTHITTQVPNISRVLYDLTGKPPGTTEWE
eukprot:TRINITY_DN2269_c0_g1_i1.p1 TRINITY_DN2269_c0_g1~~TRINITY_DN2269_c0_g1_i1.p1  ORF type:complete len:620 (+),score=121.01 TRINITY_DN2269_c0_g1_i1:429-2288(+)